MHRIRSPKVEMLLVVIVCLIAVPVSILAIRVASSSSALYPLVPAVSSSPTPDPLCSKSENGEGVIDIIDRVGDYGVLKLYDPTQKTFPPGLGRVNLIVRVDASTHIFRQQGTICQTRHLGSFRDLKAGLKLKVWSKSGVVLTTYPALIPDASDIVIVS